ncbi:MAG: hypothetical protein K2X60_11295 [Xanthobacteraceae bacterium]|nr:hypothetical protein [Xanthobacteraceae bacterium]
MLARSRATPLMNFRQAASAVLRPDPLVAAALHRHEAFASNCLDPSTAELDILVLPFIVPSAAMTAHPDAGRQTNTRTPAQFLKLGPAGISLLSKAIDADQCAAKAARTIIAAGGTIRFQRRLCSTQPRFPGVFDVEQRR